MNTAELIVVQVISLIVGMILGILGFFHINSKVTELHIIINSRMDQLLKTRGEAEFAKGVKAEEAKTRASTEEKDK